MCLVGHSGPCLFTNNGIWFWHLQLHPVQWEPAALHRLVQGVAKNNPNMRHSGCGYARALTVGCAVWQGVFVNKKEGTPLAELARVSEHALLAAGCSCVMFRAAFILSPGHSAVTCGSNIELEPLAERRPRSGSRIVHGPWVVESGPKLGVR
jgi:hypothetical protein